MRNEDDDSRPVLRDLLGRPLPGSSSPNPGGRPQNPAEVRAIFEGASVEAARRLAELIEDDDPRVALAACVVVLDLVIGKPAQSVNTDVTMTDTSRMHLSALTEIHVCHKLRPDLSAPGSDKRN